MAIDLTKTVNFGKGKAGLSTVGYTVRNSSGVVSGSRITSGVGEIAASTGIYSASIHFATSFKGSILWDTGEGTSAYAVEEYSPQLDSITSTLTLVSSSVDFIKDIEGGMWQIDKTNNQMIFYKSDNTTEVARFSLFDSDDNASVDAVFKRTRS